MKTPRLLSASCGNGDIAGLFGKRGTQERYYLYFFLQMQITVLSDALLARTLGFLPPLDLYRVRRVCKKFKTLCFSIQDTHSYWELLGLHKVRIIVETPYACRKAFFIMRLHLLKSCEILKAGSLLGQSPVQISI